MQRKIIIAVIAIILVLSAISTAQASPSTSRAVIVLMDNITWSDIIWANDPILNDIIKNSAIGLQNNRPQSAPSRPRNALTVGAGAKAEAMPSSQEAYNSDEIYESGFAREAYKVRTGRSPGRNKVIELGLPSIYTDNATGMQDFTPGYLADVLRQAGKNTAVFGNSDTSINYDRGTQSRVGAAIAINSKGIVRYGDVGKKTLTKDISYPFGVKTDYDYIEAQLSKHLDLADLIVVELGDTVRADQYGIKAYKSQYDKMRKRVLHESALSIQKMMKIAGDDTLFIVTTLSPPGTGNEGIPVAQEQLTPIIIHGPGFTPGGLMSFTTNRNNLVGTIDIAPTILDALGLPSKSIMLQGSVMKATGNPVTPEALDSFNAHAVSIKDTRRIGVLAYIYIQIALYIFAAVLLAFKKMLNKKTQVIVEIAIFTAMGFPLISFFTTKISGIAGQGYLATILTILASLVIASLLVFFRRDVLHPIIGISILTVGVLSVDIIMGAPSILDSIFGYDSIRGARYFGIGNEAMSILVANTLLLFAIMLEKSWSKWMLAAGAIMFVAITVIIGFPGLGTNTDGPITSVAAFCAMMLLAMKSKNKTRNVLITMTVMVTVLALFGIYDISTGPKTHIGKSILLIMNGGFGEVLMIINRKLAVNLMILRFSTWSYFLLITLGLLAFIGYKPVGLFKGTLENYKGVSAAISASIVAGIVGFMFNDSGILIPAIIMSYMVPTVLYLMLREQYSSTA